jgi:putative sterol carrier protein
MTAADFLKELPSKVRPELLEGIDTIFHFDLEGEGGGQYTVSVKDGQVTVDPGLIHEPKCVVKTKTETLMGIVSKDINPMMAVMTGKIKISNPGELIKYAKIFGLM